MKDIVPLIEEAVALGGTFRLYPRGTSMLPTIDQNTDSVLLCAPDTPKRDDAVLYLRDNGQYVLHRIVRVRGDVFDMSGDNQMAVEHGIRRDQIIAKLKGVFKGDKYVAADDGDMKRSVRHIRRMRYYKSWYARLARLYRKVFPKK